MTRTVALATLLAAASAAAQPATTTIKASVLTEKPAAAVSLRAYALGEALVDHPELLGSPIAEVTGAPGALALAVDPARFPLRLEATAAGHLAAAFELYALPPGTPAFALPPLWLPVGKAAAVRVSAGGKPAAGALVSGELEGGAGAAGGRWRAVVAVREADANGVAEVVLPATGEVELAALGRDGRWGFASAPLPTVGAIRLELASQPLVVAVRNPQGQPLAGVRVAAIGAPAGAVTSTDAAGRARMQIARRGSSVVVALGDGCAARAVAYGGRGETGLVCAPTPLLPVSWEGGDSLLLWPEWLSPALLGGAPLTLSGGRGAVPFLGHGGEAAVWSAGAAPQRIEVEDGAASAVVRLTAAATVAGTVVDAASRPVAGVPIWGWVLPDLGPRSMFRGPRTLEMLERSVLPRAVSGEDGRFSAAPLAPALTRLAALRRGSPPADSGPLDLAAGARREITLTLDAGTWLAVTVQDPDGRPLDGVELALVPNPEARSPRMIIRMGGADRSLTERVAAGATDREGRALLSGVPRGAMKLHARLAGYVERAIDVEVPEEGVDAGVMVLEPGVTVLGRVADEHGVGIAGAQISAGSMLGAFGAPVAESDAAGTFAVPDRPRSGEVYLQARRGEGERSDPVRVALPPQGTVELVIRSRRTLTGRVVDEETAAPVAGARVSASRVMNLMSGGGGMTFAFRMIDSTDDVETDAEGRFRLDGVAAAGEYTIDVEARGYRPLKQEVKIPEGEAPRPLTLLVKPGLSVFGVVRSSSGSPAPGAVVTAGAAARQVGPGVRFAGEGEQTSRTGEDGGFRFDGLEPGRVELKATAEEGGSAREVVEVGREEPVELVLEAPGSISGRVVDESGSPVREATVMGFSEASQYSLDNVTVDGSGSFIAERVPPGQYRVIASAPGWAQAMTQATVTAGAAATVELTLKRGGTVTGHIRGLTAKELERCEVFSRGARSKPAPDGSFTLAGVPLGPGEVGAFVMPDMKRRTVPVNLERPDQPVEVELDFAQGVTLSGTVRRRGAGVSGLIVEARGAGGVGGATTTSDAQGAWQLDGVEPGRVEVRALDRSGRVLAARALDVRDAARVELEIPGGTLAGKVVALADRAPLAGARVTATGAGEAPVSREARTDAAGAFSLEELPDGDLVVRAEAQGYAPAEARATVSMGAARDVTLSLEEEQRLRLVLREADGGVPDRVSLLPVRGGRVEDPIWVTCDRAGRVSVGSLTAGGYTFLISTGGGAALLALPVPNAETSVMLQPTGTVRALTAPGEAWRVRVVSTESGLAVPISPWQNPARGEWVDVRSGVLPLRVPAGAYVVQGIGPDGVTHEQRVAVPPEGEVAAPLGSAR